MDNLDKLRIEQSPLNLGGYFIKKLSFSISEDAERDSLNTLFLSTGLHPQLSEPLSGRPYFTLHFEVGTNVEDSSEYKCSLTVKSLNEKKSKQPYSFEAEIVAFFTWMPKEKDHPKFEAIVKNSAINLMYSTLREVLASATARSPFPALVLPAAWFKFSNEEPEAKKITPKTKLGSVRPKKKTTKQPKKS